MLKTPAFRRAALVALTLAFSLAWTGAAFADAFYTYGLSPRAIGMGNAFSATADDWSAAYYNPAGLGLQHQPGLGFGFVANFRSLTFYGVDRVPLDQAQAMIYGVNLPLPFPAGALEDRITLGVAGYMPAGRLLNLYVPRPSEPNMSLLQTCHRTNAMYPALGVRIIDGLALGGGVQTFMNLKGSIGAFIDPGGNVKTQIGEEMLMTYSPIGSLLFRPGEIWPAMEGWSFGFVFRDEAYTDYTLPVMAALDQIPFIIGFSAKSIFTPRQFVGAVGWNSDDWRFEADVSFNQWSRFPDPYLFIEPNVDIPLVPLKFKDSVRRPPHWHDTVTPRVGFEARAYEHADADLLVRAGYFYDNSPTPPQTGYTNQIDNDRHALATSLGVKWSGVGDWRFGAPLTFDLVGQTQYLPKRVVYKNDDVATDNPGYPKIGMSGFLYFVGVSMGASFDYE